MKIVAILLSFMILLGCSDEGTSQAISAEGNASEITQYKEASMLGFFGKKDANKYVVSAPLTGRLMKSGKPLAHTTIARYLEWTGLAGEKVDKFVTDEQGGFLIPAYEEMLTIGKLTEFVGKTLLVVELDGKEIEIWLMAKFDGTMYSDLVGPLNNLVCNIDQENLDLKMPHSIIATRCRWDDMPEEK